MKITITAPRVKSKRLFTLSQSPNTMKLYTIRILVAMIYHYFKFNYYFLSYLYILNIIFGLINLYCMTCSCFFIIMLIRFRTNLKQNGWCNLHSKNRPYDHNSDPKSKECHEYVTTAETCYSNCQKCTHYSMNNSRCHLSVTIPYPIVPCTLLTLVLMHDMRALVYTHANRHE